MDDPHPISQGPPIPQGGEGVGLWPWPPDVEHIYLQCSVIRRGCPAQTDHKAVLPVPARDNADFVAIIRRQEWNTTNILYLFVRIFGRIYEASNLVHFFVLAFVDVTRWPSQQWAAPHWCPWFATHIPMDSKATWLHELGCMSEMFLWFQAVSGRCALYKFQEIVVVQDSRRLYRPWFQSCNILTGNQPLTPRNLHARKKKAHVLPGNLKYPSVFCGSDHHIGMLVAGWLLLALGALSRISASCTLKWSAEIMILDSRPWYVWFADCFHLSLQHVQK